MSDRDDERVQPALHALLSGDVDGLRAALEADPGAVNLRVGDWVAPDGSLRADPGPCRPNWADVGRPAGTPPTDDPVEIVGEAFVFAALNDRRDVVDYLLDAGADIDARPYRNTTALHFAIQFQRSDMVRHLLDRGASVTIEDANHGSDASGWAQACDDGSEAAASIRALLSAAAPG